VLFLANCKDEVTVVRIEPELKEWGFFEKGSWWVYEEEVTKQRDSFWVDSTGAALKGLPDDDILFQELRTFISSLSNINNDYIFFISSGTNMLCLTSKSRWSSDPEIDESAALLRIPVTSGERFGSHCDLSWIIIDSVFDSLTIGNAKFRNVVRTQDKGNCALMGTQTAIYSVRNIGIVRKEFPDFHQTWNLVKHHVVQ
jgi:hypothetical protein